METEKMDMKDMIRMRGEQTEDHLLKKVDKICDEADDAGYLSHEDIRALKNAWETIDIIERHKAAKA
jgi:hypothetical protein|nr:MAG TPA: hypothetical protein [Caudoviricetes sp.]